MGKTVVEILLCMLATVGMYAICCRVIVWLFPRGGFTIAVRGEKLTVEETVFLAKSAPLYAETNAHFRPDPVVLLETDDPQKTDTLRKEGILVYIRKKAPENARNE